MVYQGMVPPSQAIENLNNVRFDVKRVLRLSQEEISQLISDLADPKKSTLTIDGRIIDKKDTLALGLAVNAKLETLQNKTNTITDVFKKLISIENSLGSSSGA